MIHSVSRYLIQNLHDKYFCRFYCLEFGIFKAIFMNYLWSDIQTIYPKGKILLVLHKMHAVLSSQILVESSQGHIKLQLRLIAGRILFKLQ